MSKLSKRLMSLHYYRKIGNNVPHFSDFLHLKIMISIFYKYKQIKVPNLVYLEVQVLLHIMITPLYPLIYRFSLYSLIGR